MFTCNRKCRCSSFLLYINSPPSMYCWKIKKNHIQPRNNTYPLYWHIHPLSLVSACQGCLLPHLPAAVFTLHYLLLMFPLFCSSIFSYFIFLCKTFLLVTANNQHIIQNVSSLLLWSAHTLLKTYNCFHLSWMFLAVKHFFPVINCSQT